MNRDEPPGVSEHPLRTAQIMGTFGGGGAQRLAYNLALGLAQQGVRSLAVALRSRGNYAEAVRASIGLAALGADARRPFTLVRALIALVRLMSSERIDLVHVHGAQSLPFVVFATRLLRRRPRLAFTWHDSESVLEQKSWRRRVMLWALRRCDLVSGSSGAVGRTLRERAGLERVDVFHGGVPDTRKPAAKNPAQPLILWVGRVVPPKDPQALIRAAAKLRAEGLRFNLCIAGGPTPSTQWYMDETRALIGRLGMEAVTATPGFLGDADLNRMLDKADIAVQTSHTEGLSLALLEQMMAGLAIVATDVGDTRCAVEDGLTGLLVPAKDEQRLIDALRRLLAEPALRAQLAGAARQRAVERFSVPAMAREAVAWYRSTMADL